MLAMALISDKARAMSECLIGSRGTERPHQCGHHSGRKEFMRSVSSEHMKTSSAGSHTSSYLPAFAEQSPVRCGSTRCAA